MSGVLSNCRNLPARLSTACRNPCLSLRKRRALSIFVAIAWTLCMIGHAEKGRSVSQFVSQGKDRGYSRGMPCIKFKDISKRGTAVIDLQA